MKLCAYTINGNKIGIDILSWTSNDINNSDPFLILNDSDTVPNNYVDITSIENWYNFSPDDKVGAMQIIDSSISIGYNNLSSAEKTIVDELSYYYLIYKYIYDINNKTNINLKAIPDISYSLNEAPYNLDYDVVGLHKRQYFVKGELLKVEYYGQYDPIAKTYADLCVKEDRVYNRQDAFLYNRTMTISWYKSDGTIGGTKNTVKYYNTFDAIIAGNERRENIIDEMKIVVVGLIQMTEQIDMLSAQVIGLQFLASISDNITLYVKGNDGILIQQVANDTQFDFLNNVISMAGTNAYTIRDYVMDALTIDYNKVYSLSDQSPFSFFNTI